MNARRNEARGPARSARRSPPTTSSAYPAYVLRRQAQRLLQVLASSSDVENVSFTQPMTFSRRPGSPRSRAAIWSRNNRPNASTNRIRNSATAGHHEQDGGPAPHPALEPADGRLHRDRREPGHEDREQRRPGVREDEPAEGAQRDDRQQHQAGRHTMRGDGPGTLRTSTCSTPWTAVLSGVAGAVLAGALPHGHIVAPPGGRSLRAGPGRPRARGSPQRAGRRTDPDRAARRRPGRTPPPTSGPPAAGRRGRARATAARPAPVRMRHRG